MKPAVCAHPTGRSSACCHGSKKSVGRLHSKRTLILHHLITSISRTCPSARPGLEIQVVCRCRIERGLRRKRRKRRKQRAVSGKETPLPVTFNLQFKLLTPAATLGYYRPPPFPPLICIITSPVPPTQPPFLHLVTLHLPLLPPLITISALLPP